MDPVTAAGIGLSVTSIALQVFSGCIKGYQLFIDCRDLPVTYEHLRTRLRIEQTRCLQWGESVGLLEDMLDEPSKLIQLHHNLIFDILQQVQSSFRSCLVVTTKFDPHIRNRSPSVLAPPQTPIAPRKLSFLDRTLAFWEKGGRVAGRLEWAMLKKDGFEKLVVQLIEYNNRIETFLDRSTLKDLRTMHVQSNLVLLQVTDQVTQLRDLVQALKLGAPAATTSGVQTLSRASTLVQEDDQGKGELTLLSLATFKTHHLEMTKLNGSINIPMISIASVKLDFVDQRSMRQFGRLGRRKVWLEWREDFGDFDMPADYAHKVDQRIQALAAVLSAKDKPAEVCSPDCLGYVRTSDDKHGGADKFALVLSQAKAAQDDTTLVSLRPLLNKRLGIALDVRIALVKRLAEALLSLHAVNWIHKGICSDSILLQKSPNGFFIMKDPILSGFETSRPALPDEITVPYARSEERDLYRHPDLHTMDSSRSKRSHDIYSFGLVMIEIALWRPIEQIVKLEVPLRRREIGKLRSAVLDDQNFVFADVAERVGWRYADVARACISGGKPIGIIDDNDNEEDPAVGSRMISAFFENILLELRALVV
ncbi:hypothetical protein B0A48_07965 [Cryoendolithus antarcticus]|uniref:Protein kinase domain-containing protein n=1 Tax=Cryoendolithus antarcticus TaxID=1507870 RepID=A0A1V8T0K9_9PEZI|nr:hypothetical protein B0A48_07965 [Cryoendolithus antarcticus]